MYMNTYTLINIYIIILNIHELETFQYGKCEIFIKPLKRTVFYTPLQEERTELLNN